MIFGLLFIFACAPCGGNALDASGEAHFDEGILTTLKPIGGVAESTPEWKSSNSTASSLLELDLAAYTARTPSDEVTRRLTSPTDFCDIPDGIQQTVHIGRILTDPQGVTASNVEDVLYVSDSENSRVLRVYVGGETRQADIVMMGTQGDPNAPTYNGLMFTLDFPSSVVMNADDTIMCKTSTVSAACSSLS